MNMSIANLIVVFIGLVFPPVFRFYLLKNKIMISVKKHRMIWLFMTSVVSFQFGSSPVYVVIAYLIYYLLWLCRFLGR